MRTHVYADSGGDRHTWALVLAAGEGRRLSSMTTTAFGTSIPKQYCSLWGGHSLLQDTVQRAQRAVARDRVCTVVASAHRRWWEPLLWSLPARNTIVQPDNRGTFIGVLLPLLHILRRDPSALVLVLPSDHHVRDESVLVGAMRGALTRARRYADSVVLLGFKPDEADPELGYIVPAGTRDHESTLQVEQFVEKPTPTVARDLIERQALWNGFIVAASARALLSLYQARDARIVESLQRVAERDADRPVDAAAAAEAYDGLPLLDFSRDLLQGMEERLRVLPVPDCGWSDLGCPRAIAKAVRLGTGGSGPRGHSWAAPTLNLSAHAHQDGTEPSDG